MRPAKLFVTLTILASLCVACAHRSSAAQQAARATFTPSSGVGAALYAKNCAACHGNGGVSGPIGPPLAGERRRKTRAAIVRAIEFPDPPMPKLYPGTLSEDDVENIAAYVESL